MNTQERLERFRLTIRSNQDDSADTLTDLVKYITENQENQSQTAADRIAQKRCRVDQLEAAVKVMTENLALTQKQYADLTNVYEHKVSDHCALEDQVEISLKEYERLLEELEHCKSETKATSDDIVRDACIFEELFGLELSNTDTDEFHIKLKSIIQSRPNENLTLICRKALSGQLLNLILEHSDPQLPNMARICEMVNNKELSWLQCLALCRQLYAQNYDNYR